jgi:hypothetical protein
MLVTNALVHGNGQIEVYLSYARGSLRAQFMTAAPGGRFGSIRPRTVNPAAAWN